MSLATIDIEQQAPAKWSAWISAGYPRCTRQRVIAVCLPSLMIAIARAYQGMVPEKQIWILLEDDQLFRPKTKFVMSDEHKRKMAEGRTRSAAARRAEKNEAVEMHDAEPARTDD